MTTKLKVGDKVRVREDLAELDSDIGPGIVSKMWEYAGKEVTIEEVIADNRYSIIGSIYIFSDEMFEDFDQIHALKEEIASKQRELAKLVKEQSKPKYKFEVEDNVILTDSDGYVGPNTQPGQCGKIIRHLKDVDRYKINLGAEILSFPDSCFKLVSY